MLRSILHSRLTWSVISISHNRSIVHLLITILQYRSAVKLLNGALCDKGTTKLGMHVQSVPKIMQYTLKRYVHTYIVLLNKIAARMLD